MTGVQTCALPILTQPPLSSPPSLSRQAELGTFWNYLSFATGKLLNFATTIILARLLVPEQFGLIGYCTIAIQYLDIMNTAGIDNALIARKEKLEEASNAAFVINIFMGIISFGFAWLIAPKIAVFFHAEQVTAIFRLLAVVLPISGLGLVPDTLIQRSLRFRTRLIPEVSRNLAKGLTSIILALLGWGVWSLVWGQIVGNLISVVLCWILVDWRPTFKYDIQVTKELMGYGSHIIVIGFAGALLDNVDYIITGRLMGAAALGYYTMAYRIPELAIRSLNQVAARILFPLLSRTQSDIDSLRTFYFNYIRYISIFTFSIGTGLALVSNLFVETFMSTRWEPAILPMSLIALAMAISSAGYAPGVLYKSINRPEILTRVNLVKLPIIFALLLFCARWGFNGIAFGQVIFAVLSVCLDSIVVSRVIHLKIIKFVDALAPAIISSLVMAAIVIPIQLFLSPSGWLGLGFVSITGVVVYILALSFVNRKITSQIYATLRGEIFRS